ncbi:MULTISPECIES: sulfurtransferase complex subunit TusB [Vibrio]|jgi:tRNA 2-thiouridine synthesizing protein B|uniref:Sulfur relay protein DsrH n=2 Tax=Vibrio TaxID=662 RepID=A0A2N7JLM7_VIBSP|nr:sulfurtransferase complex subunit TusB [Vibrio splendidus]OED73077.1 sulfur relay protein DsrH [Vibrio splendidus ZS-139]PMM42272.1 sulfur relay protein DsrH [Vibrio splendidus]TVU60218.1 sulfurtransferase complex subunit TusB [Vibrio atlanticus]
MLHIVRSVDKLKLALTYSQQQDHFLLTEDAVYVCLPNHELFNQISMIERVSVLKPDLNSRGLQQLVSGSFIQVDFDGFVELTVLNDKSVTW